MPADDLDNWSASLDTALEFLDAMERRKHDLANEIKAIDQSIATTRGDLLAMLKEAGVTSDNRPLATVSVSSGSMSVVCDMPEALPARFVRTKTEPDKRAIGDAMKGGQSVIGCRFERGPDKLSITWRKDNA